MNILGRRLGGSDRSIFFSLYAPAFTLALGHGVAIPAIPVFAQSFNVSFGVASLVIIVYMFGTAVASLPTGYLVDRLGRRRMVLAGAVMTAAASFMTANAQTFPELLVYRFIAGWATETWVLARIALIADTGGGSRGRQITGMFGTDNLGRLIGPAIGGFAAVWDIRAPFILHGVLSVLATIPLFMTIKDPPRSASAKAGHGESIQLNSLAELKALVLTVPILILLSVQLFSGMARGSLYGGSFHLYPVYAYDIGPDTLGIMVAGVTALAIPLTFAAGHLMDRFGRKATIVPGFACLSLALAGLAVTALFQMPFAAFVVGLSLVYLSQGITGGNMQTLGSDVAPDYARGTFLGIWALVGRTGTFLSPVAFAFLAEVHGYASGFLILGLAALVVALLVGTQVKETFRKRDVARAGTQTG